MASPFRRSSLACRSSRFSRSSAFIFPAGVLARRPLSSSGFLIRSFSVCDQQSLFAEIDGIADQRLSC